MGNVGTKCKKCSGFIQVAYYREELPKMCDCSESEYKLPSDLKENKVVVIEKNFFNGVDFHVTIEANGIPLPRYCGCFWCEDLKAKE